MAKFDFISVTRHFIEAAKTNRLAIGLAVAVTVVSFIMFSLQQLSQEVTRILELSPSNPWGFFTSIFLHRNWDHILGNMSGMWIWVFYILIAPSLLSEEEKKKRARFFIPAVLSAAIASAIGWVVALNYFGQGQNYSSVGASGLVYAFAGATLGFSIMNLVDAFSKYDAKDVPKRKVRGVLIMNGIIVAMLLVMVQANPSVFLSRGPGVNTFVHGFGFMIALALTMGREYSIRIRKWVDTRIRQRP